ICHLIKQENYRRFFDNKTFLVMAHHKNNLIIYDDTQPFQLKNHIVINGTVEYKSNFIINSQIGGVLIHHIDMDDYIGLSCNLGAYPISSVVSRIFSQSKSYIKPTTTTATITLNNQYETTKIRSTVINNLCSGVKTEQLIEDKIDCRYYYVCQSNNSKPISHLQCPQNMFFSMKEKACTHQNSDCSSKSMFNSMAKSIEQTQKSLSRQSDKRFQCQKANGIFADLYDCRQYILCSNNIPFIMKCPSKTKFNSLLNRCDEWSNICP
ncbi:unnamed protein product, partial [Rotaria sordida]